jgi:tellurite resistance protein TerC
LKYGVAVILAYVGIKMIISDFYAVPTWISLLFISFSISLSVVLSIMKRKKDASSVTGQSNEL